MELQLLSINDTITKTIKDIPYELLSQILKAACLQVVDDAPTDQPMVHFGKGILLPDSSKWIASNAIRQVNHAWHEWALSFALHDLYMFSWRGSEHYLQSGIHISQAPVTLNNSRAWSIFLEKTATLVTVHPAIGSHVKRILFEGYQSPQESATIFNILKHCKNLTEVELPWTLLKCGSVAEWAQLFPADVDGAKGPAILSLNIQAVGLPRRFVKWKGRDNSGERAQGLTGANFNRLRRFKIAGWCNFFDVSNTDLNVIARTATGLKEIHFNGTLDGMTEGVEAILNASLEKIEIFVLGFVTGRFDMGSEDVYATHSRESCRTIFHKLADCANLRSLTLDTVEMCVDLLARTDLMWNGSIQIRIIATSFGQYGDARGVLWQILDTARARMNSTNDPQLNIEIVLNDWLFEPQHKLVYGRFDGRGSDPTWRPASLQTTSPEKDVLYAGAYEKKFPSHVSEDDFRAAATSGVLYF